MTTNPSARTFSSDFKRFFVRGLVVLLPTVLTLWIVVKAYQFIDSTIAEPINGGIRLGLAKTAAAWEPLRNYFGPTEDVIAENVQTWWTDRWYMDLIGLVVAIVAVYIAGRLLGGFFGRRIYKKIESVITTLPVFKQVYPYVKQVVDFLFGDERSMEFNRVVIVQYPRKGIWTMGFLTGDTMKSIARESGDAVTVFVPSSPAPFTGYTITVPRREVIELPITVEQAIRFTVTGGVVMPEHQLIQGGVEPLPSSAPDAPRAQPIPLPREQQTPTPADTPPDPESRRDAG